MEKVENIENFVRRLDALKLWLGMLGATINLNRAGNENLYLLMTGSRYLLIGKDCIDQTRHNDLNSRKVGAQVCLAGFCIESYM